MQCFKFMCGVKKRLACFAILFQLPIVNGSMTKLSLAKNYNANEPALFKEFSELLAKYKPLNFGLGYPDFGPPEILQNALAKAAISNNYETSQYAPEKGHPRLLKAVATLFSKLSNQILSPDENVAITVGACEALYAIFQAHTNPGDEWIIFEPYFYLYDAMVKAAHGVPRYIPLIASKTTGYITSTDFKFNKMDLAHLFNNRTKGILVNTPHNPTGKVFDYEELMYIAELAKKWNVIVIYDEVYQFMIYGNAEHHRIATFPGMFERTITVGSAGKMFAATGYRIGWAYGPKHLIDNIVTVDFLIVMSAPTPMQEAMAVAIEEETRNYGRPDSYMERFRRESAIKRNRIYDILTEAGMTPIFSESGYFIIANWTSMLNSVQVDKGMNGHADYSFVKWLIKNVNVYGLPLSRAYGVDNMHIGQNYVRFTIIKSDETLDEVGKTLKKWKSKLTYKQHV